MKRRAFLRLRERYARRGLRFVYVDESGFEPEAARRYGRAPRGQKVYGLRSGHRRPRTSLLAARIDGRLEATMLFEGHCDAAFFNMWLARELCPLLDERCVVILDNVPFHKSARTREIVGDKGAKILFLPPYSPDLNDIEHDFATIKKLREYNEHESLDDIIRMYD